MNAKSEFKKRKKINFICFPYAGASTNYFESIRSEIEKLMQQKVGLVDIRFIEVTLPGRGARYGEPLLKNIDSMVDDIWQQIQHLVHQPYAFFGHSMGSLLAYILAHKVRRLGLALPTHLFLSGRGGPSKTSNKNNHLLSFADFKAKLQGYGGISTEILNDDAIFSFFEPSIRADFKAVETWKYRYRPQLNLPVTVFSGTTEDITEEELKAWEKEFECEVQFQIFEGGHFFINNHAKSMALMMVEQLQSKQLQHAY